MSAKDVTVVKFESGCPICGDFYIAYPKNVPLPLLLEVKSKDEKSRDKFKTTFTAIWEKR